MSKDLNVKALARGRHSRAVQDAAFSEVRRQLAYKSDWYGRAVVKVDRWYPSSKTCSECQHTLDELRLDERRWRCPRCGFHHDRGIRPRPDAYLCTDRLSFFIYRVHGPVMQS